MLALGTISILIFLLHREMTTPLLVPSTIDIVTAAPPRTEAPPTTVLNTYTVPGDHPRRLIIDRLGVVANILPMGVTKDNAIDAPKTAWDTGWYKDGTKPGSGLGAALIDGHVNDAFNTPGVFAGLSELAIGDTVVILRGDDTRLVYSVASVDQEPLERIDMESLLRSADLTKEGVTLITCGGIYNKKLGTYGDRIIVKAVRVS